MNIERSQRLREYGRFAVYVVPCLAAIAFARFTWFPHFHYLVELLSGEAATQDEMYSMVSDGMNIVDTAASILRVVGIPILIFVILAEVRFEWWRSARNQILDSIQLVIVIFTLFGLVVISSMGPTVQTNGIISAAKRLNAEAAQNEVSQRPAGTDASVADETPTQPTRSDP